MRLEKRVVLSFIYDKPSPAYCLNFFLPHLEPCLSGFENILENLQR